MLKSFYHIVMRKNLIIKEKTFEIIISNNSRTEDSEQNLSKSVINCHFRDNNNSFSYNDNLLENYDIIQYKNFKLPRLELNNEYNFDKYKKCFDILFNKISINYYLTKHCLHNILEISNNLKNKKNENLITHPKGIMGSIINKKIYYLKDNDYIYKQNENINSKNNESSQNNIEIKNEMEIISNEKINNNSSYSKRLINQPKYTRRIFHLKMYDKNKNLIKKKRGRISSKKEIIHIHSALDEDNVLRKIQVHFLTFLVSFTNDYIDTIFPNLKKYQILHFRHINYQFKKTINHQSIEKMKNLTIGEILQKQASPKNKTCVHNINEIIYNKLCEKCPYLRKNYFNKLFKQFFLEYYYNKRDQKIIVNGMKVNLSTKTRGFNSLIQKNIKFKDKFINIATYFFINNSEEKVKDSIQNGNENDKEFLIEKPFFIIY